jgi:molybdopterin synthase sulfur carrier subunit
MPTVFIPSLMRKLTDGKEQVEVSGGTVRRVIASLDEQYPGIKDRLVEDGRMKRNISVAVDGEVCRLGLLEKVQEDSEVHFIPAVGGG